MTLKIVNSGELKRFARQPFDAETLRASEAIVSDVETRRESALREYRIRFAESTADAPSLIPREQCAAALDALRPEFRRTLERTAQRIHKFAVAQRESLSALTIEIPGGYAGHSVLPFSVAGCYAPGGRYPLPSSVLMTAVTARTAGVDTVCLATPNPTAETLAAAAIAKVDYILNAGGAHAIAALAFGVGGIPAADVIVGPGNRFVTAAKFIVSRRVRIDMLAGPSELVIVADRTADPEIIAADLLAQAEHDDDALPVLLSHDPRIIERTNVELTLQLAELPTASVARRALENGFAVSTSTLRESIEICNQLAPEHVELIVDAPEIVVKEFNAYGSLFVGGSAAEVFGDYGAGPNHVLPTGGTARSVSGLSVFNFLRTPTWLRINPLVDPDLLQDAVQLGEMEGLIAHARAAALRRI